MTLERKRTPQHSWNSLSSCACFRLQVQMLSKKVRMVTKKWKGGKLEIVRVSDLLMTFNPT